MGENGLLQQMRKPVSTGLILGMLLTPKLLSQAEKATPESSLENKSGNTTIINNYYYPENTPGVYFDNHIWHPYYFNPGLNRTIFRRMQRGAWIEFDMHINQFPGYGINFYFQAGVPYYTQNYNPNIIYYDTRQLFNQGNAPRVKISPRIRNMGRRH